MREQHTFKENTVYNYYSGQEYGYLQGFSNGLDKGIESLENLNDVLVSKSNSKSIITIFKVENQLNKLVFNGHIDITGLTNDEINDIVDNLKKRGI